MGFFKKKGKRKKKLVDDAAKMLMELGIYNWKIIDTNNTLFATKDGVDCRGQTPTILYFLQPGG